MPYQIVVVDDSAFMRRIISDLIEQDEAFKVVGTANNGRDAIDVINKLSPDLVTMDVEMPELNGLEALKEIMKTHPLPVIMLSGINEQGMQETIMALESGAFDFIRKPSVTTSSHDISEVGAQLRNQIKAAMFTEERKKARSLVIEKRVYDIVPPIVPPIVPKTAPLVPKGIKPRKETTELNPVVSKAPPAKVLPTKVLSKAKKKENEKEKKLAVSSAPASPNSHKLDLTDGNIAFTELVAIGTSTGGPKALKAVLEKIPATFPAPIVIVQHMPPNFTKSLAERLDTLCSIKVVEAKDGMILSAGTAYIAPGGYHMNITSSAGGKYKISLTTKEPRGGHRPSVDVLYESLLTFQSLKRHIVLLTGMGSDGAKGMKQLFDSGVTSTIAESEETCVVYGMPRSAIELQCVQHVLPVHEIGAKLVEIVK